MTRDLSAALQSISFPSIFCKCKTYMSLSCSKHTKASLHNLKVSSFLTMTCKAPYHLLLPLQLISDHSLCTHSPPANLPSFCGPNTPNLVSCGSLALVLLHEAHKSPPYLTQGCIPTTITPGTLTVSVYSVATMILQIM